VSQGIKNDKCSIINSSYPFWDNPIDGFCGVVNSMTELELHQRALRIMAKEILGWGLLWEEIMTTGDIDAHVDIPGDQTEEIDKMVEEYLEEAREELNETICTD
jgi:hypothetical protein